MQKIYFKYLGFTYKLLIANLSILKRLPKRITKLYKELKNMASKVHRTAGSISFKKTVLHHEVIPKFAQVKINFINVNGR